VKAARLALVAVVVLGVLGLVTWWGGRDGPAPAAIDRPPVPAALKGSALSATWYCAAATAAVPTSHVVLIANPTRAGVSVRLTAFGPDGPVPSTTVAVAPGGPTAVDVAATFGNAALSVMVESPVASLTVAHQLVAAQDGDQAACSTFSSDTWYFPSLATTRDAGARLTLFNPFPGDAGVDVQVVLDTGVRVPTALTGIVVPARTAKVVDLGEAVQRRDQFAIAVKLRSGRVVAEAAQTFDGSAGPRGLRLGLGVPAASQRWVLAGGFTGTGVAERLVVQNPTQERATVLVQVTPYGGSADPPEPLSVEVPKRRYAVVDLSAEGRIPGDGYHSITVESDRAVVVGRTTAITAAPSAPADPNVATRPALKNGVAIGTGSPVGALDWIVPFLDAGADPAPVVFVHNPGTGISVVSVTSLSAGTSTPVPDATRVEIPPGDSRAVTVPAPAGGPAGVAVRVTGSSPVVVEQLVTFPAQGDLGFGLAVPVRGGRSGLSTLTG
jgi:hypothetical protein